MPAIWSDDRLSASEGVFEAVVQSVQLLNREALTIAQRNVKLQLQPIEEARHDKELRNFN